MNEIKSLLGADCDRQYLRQIKRYLTQFIILRRITGIIDEPRLAPAAGMYLYSLTRQIVSNEGNFTFNAFDNE